MKIKKRTLGIASILSILGVFVLFMPANAQSTCGGWLPEFLGSILCNSNPVDLIQNRLQTGFVIAFGVVIIIAVAYIIMASIKYIRSKGEPGEMEASNKSMQAIFYGVGAIFVGVLGIALVIMFFNPNIIFPSEICIQNPDSYGCYACNNGFDAICDECNDDPEFDIDAYTCETDTSDLDDEYLETDKDSILDGANGALE